MRLAAAPRGAAWLTTPTRRGGDPSDPEPEPRLARHCPGYTNRPIGVGGYRHTVRDRGESIASDRADTPLGSRRRSRDRAKPAAALRSPRERHNCGDLELASGGRKRPANIQATWRSWRQLRTTLVTAPASAPGVGARDVPASLRPAYHPPPALLALVLLTSFRFGGTNAVQAGTYGMRVFKGDEKLAERKFTVH